MNFMNPQLIVSDFISHFQKILGIRKNSTITNIHMFNVKYSPNFLTYTHSRAHA